MTWVPDHAGFFSVDDTTYFGIVFIFTPNSPTPSIVGHAAANPS